MADILFIKTSSLGDVIHHMPAVTEARKARPDATIRLAGGGGLCAAGAAAPGGRRGHPGRLAALAQVAVLRRRRCAEIAGEPCARSARAATTRSSTARVCCARRSIARARAWPAPRLRRAKHPRAAGVMFLRLCAIASAASCMRSSATACLSGLALGYTPQGAPDFGLDRARFARARERYAVLLHATARARKAMAGSALDRARARQLGTARGLELVLPWGSEAERARSERIAAAAAGCARARAGAARSGRAADRRRAIRRRRRYRADASCRRVRRAAGRDLHRQRARADRPGRQRADRRARRRRRAAIGRRSCRRGRRKSPGQFDCYAAPARSRSWMCMMPTGLPASTANSAVTFVELRISSVSLIS